MKTPDKIYLNIPKEELKAPLDSTTWDTKAFNDCINVEYIRKDALLEWLKDMIDYSSKERQGAYQNVIDKINSL